MTSRRKLTWWAACAATGAVLAGMTASPARADSSGFLDAVHDLGWYNRATGDVGLLDQGYAVCRALREGYNGSQVAAAIYGNTGLDVTYDDAAVFVILAVENLCPQFDHRSGSTAA